MNMNRSVFTAAVLGIAFSLSACTSRNGTGESGEGLDVITPSLMQRYITELSSDAMKGRNTPSRQLDSAAGIIAHEFEEAGLTPLNGTYYQRVALNTVHLGTDNRLSITIGGEKHDYVLKADFVPFEMTANREVSAEIVFAGYGITAPEYRYDDYAGIDARGKIVLVLRHEPGEDDPKSPFEGTKSTKYSSVAEKVRCAVAHGAVAVLLATDPLNHTSLMPRGFPWPSLTTIIPEDAVPITLAAAESKKVPVVHIGPAVLSDLFGSVETLAAIQKRIDSTMTPVKVQLRGAACVVKTSTVIKGFSAKNVVGFCEGSDPERKNEVVIIGAHYDHVGVMKDAPAGKDSVYHGADDNASGTAGMMVCAKAFGTMSEKPERSVLFIAFAGEEEGLLGSEAYVEQPLVPVSNTVAMINLDMIGRNTIDSVYLVSAEVCPDLTKIVHGENRYIGMRIGTIEEKVMYESDHGSFLREKIPSVYFHSGLHGDYHQTTDTADKINFHKAARIVRLAFRTALHIAHGSGRYQCIIQ